MDNPGYMIPVDLTDELISKVTPDTVKFYESESGQKIFEVKDKEGNHVCWRAYIIFGKRDG